MVLSLLRMRSRPCCLGNAEHVREGDGVAVERRVRVGCERQGRQLRVGDGRVALGVHARSSERLRDLDAERASGATEHLAELDVLDRHALAHVGSDGWCGGLGGRLVLEDDEAEPLVILDVEPVAGDEAGRRGFTIGMTWSCRFFRPRP